MDDQEASKSAAQIPFVNFKGWNLKKIVSSTFKLSVIKKGCWAFSMHIIVDADLCNDNVNINK